MMMCTKVTGFPSNCCLKLSTLELQFWFQSTFFQYFMYFHNSNTTAMKTLLAILAFPFALMAQNVSVSHNAANIANQLNEVHIQSSYKRAIVKEVDPVSHQNNGMLYMSSPELQYAFYIPSVTQRSYVKNLALPLMKAAFEAEGMPGTFDKVTFTTLIKIEFLQSAGGKPGEKISANEQTAIVSNADNSKQFDITLNEQQEVPEGGLFVQLTILGRADVNGKLLQEQPYSTFKDEGGVEVKMPKYVQPNFPLVEKPKGTATFIRYTYADSAAWHVINEPHLHEIKDYPDFNIGFGYTTVSYK